MARLCDKAAKLLEARLRTATQRIAVTIFLEET